MLVRYRSLSRFPSARSQRGISIVELMVGVTIGLFVVAAASLMVSSQLGDNRRLLLETQLQQDLRATSDIITRELRRASYFSQTANEIWFEGKASPVSENAYGALTPVSGDDLSDISFKYRRRSGDEGPFGFRLNGTELQSRVATNWQSLTDSRVLQVTAFDIDLSAPVSYPLPCPRLCADGTQDCWPSLQMRTATVQITGRSVSDAAIVRSLVTQVRLRNDFTKFNDVTICPT
jgi:type II secretory pathway component PulJ